MNGLSATNRIASIRSQCIALFPESMTAKNAHGHKCFHQPLLHQPCILAKSRAHMRPACNFAVFIASWRDQSMVTFPVAGIPM
ncbi:MAG: hypothetical protein ACREPT_01400, partial [Rudaea sp.]